MSQSDSSANTTHHSTVTSSGHGDEAKPRIGESTPDEEEKDDFGLPRSPARQRPPPDGDQSSDVGSETFHDTNVGDATANSDAEISTNDQALLEESSTHQETSPSERVPVSENAAVAQHDNQKGDTAPDGDNTEAVGKIPESTNVAQEPNGDRVDAFVAQPSEVTTEQPERSEETGLDESAVKRSPSTKKGHHSKNISVSEWSHQRLAPQEDEEDEDSAEDEWQAMPAVAEYDLYNDDGKLIAKAVKEEDLEEATYGGLGGAGKGYTRVQLDDDARSATSMDDDTRYLFKEVQRNNLVDDEEQRDAVEQLQATKDLLTEGQRIAYVGVTRLTMHSMTQELENARTTRHTKKGFAKSLESMKKWSQQMMVRLYAHMEIDTAEQLMIEQLAEHGVQPADLAPPLKLNSKVNNPMADADAEPRSSSASMTSPKINGDDVKSPTQQSVSEQSMPSETSELSDHEDVPQVHTPSQMTHDAKIDLDLRWTVLCDLFLVLVSDAAYDARSRVLLERVGAAMDISWVQICRFEKRVIDALEMQEEKDKENWNEDEHLEARRKQGLKHKYMVMGLATVGGGLVIGLSAGLLAPVIGAGLAAGFTTIGVTGTAGFLGGVGGAAMITSAATAAGGTIAIRASNRRTGHVKTFEYRPLHNNKRLNLIVTISGWMSGKVDDVRLPYSTVDPIMGDIYSLLWEPEMLQSMGDTINILANEALTQAVQQVLGATLLVALMASLQLPIVLTKLAYLIDNPWTVSLDRANAAGLILADSLIDRHLGNRPITLVGFSLGSRLIFSCLRELAHREVYGLIQNVYLFGSPVVAKQEEYLKARTVISGRFVNGYASNDWILGYLFRATSGGVMRVAGLAPVEGVPGLENIDVTSMVQGHMAYRAAMPRLLRAMGWEVVSDEFTEIEDPDPENHAKRQRELIREIDEARKEAEAKAGKKRFGLFRKAKVAQKKAWETYENDDSASKSEEYSEGSTEPNVLFDIEAIKRELESEMIEVKELDSTLPPMKLDFGGDAAATKAPREMLRQTKSSDAALSSRDPPPSPSTDSLPIRITQSQKESQSDSTSNQRSLSEAEHTTNGANDGPSPFELDFESPRELKSTLPPLTIQLLPAKDVNQFTEESQLAIRPDLKSHATMPVNGTASSSFTVSNIDHNAWAEEGEFGNEGEIKMSFE